MLRRAAGEHVERLRLDRAGGFEDLRAARWAIARPTTGGRCWPSPTWPAGSGRSGRGGLFRGAITDASPGGARPAP